jgi:hypothetical protein
MHSLLLLLMPFLFQLQYDDSRRVGDVAVTVLDKWRDLPLQQYYQQKAKLDRMMRRTGKPAPSEDELAEQADLVQNLRTTIDLLDAPLVYMGSLGYRLHPPVNKTPNLPPARPAPPEGK